MSKVNVKEIMSASFKGWLYLAMAVSGLIALCGFVLGGMGDWISGLCIFMPAALICWSLWMVSGGKKTGLVIMLLTAVSYVAIYVTSNPFAFTENALAMNLLVSRPYAEVVILTFFFAIREWKLFSGYKG